VKAEEIERIKELRRDPRAFFKLLQVFDNNAGKMVPFVLTPTQEEYLKILETSKRIVIVKARQLGISTVTRAWFLWQAWRASQPIKHAVISYTRESANHLHSIDKQFFVTLPERLQRKLSTDSKGSIRWDDTGAELRTFSAGGKAGATRSYSFSSCHISEFAFFDDQNELLSNVISSVGDGQIIIETTVKAADDFYHNLVRGAEAGENEWTLAFFPWHKEKKYSSHPRWGFNGVPKPTDDELDVKRRLGLTLSQLYWRHTQIGSMGWEKFHREFPSTIQEAFYTKGISWLSADAYAALIPVDMGRGPAWTYEEPIEGQRYAMGVDVANGTGGDYSTITVVSVTTRQPVFHWADNKTPPFKFAEVCFEQWERWNECAVLVEGNGVGAVIVGALEQWGVPLWKSDKGTDWKTDKWSKVRIFERLREALEAGSFEELHKDLVEEIKSLVPNKWGSCAAKKGAHDDLVMSLCLALECAESVPDFADYVTKRGLIDEWKKKTRANKLLLGKIPFRPAGLKRDGPRRAYK